MGLYRTTAEGADWERGPSRPFWTPRPKITVNCAAYGCSHRFVVDSEHPAHPGPFYCPSHSQGYDKVA